MRSRPRKPARKTPDVRLQPIAVTEGSKVVDLSSYEISLLKELMVAGELGRNVSRSARNPLTRLVDAGYVTIKAGTPKSTQYVISPRGLQALAVAASDDP